MNSSDFVWETTSDGKITITEYTGEAGEVTVPSEIDGKPAVFLDEYAFTNSSTVTAVTIPAGITALSGGISGGTAFSGSETLKCINVSADNEYFSSADGVLFNKDKTELIRFPAGRTETEYAVPEGVKKICKGAFNRCSSLNKITIPDSVTEIGDAAFCLCSSLTEMTIPESVTKIGFRMAGGCEALKSVKISGAVGEIPSQAFDECSSLTSVKLPDSITVIGDSAFKECGSLADITIPGSIAEIAGFAFFRCEALTAITLPDGIKKAGKSAFHGCENLTVTYKGAQYKPEDRDFDALYEAISGNNISG